MRSVLMVVGWIAVLVCDAAAGTFAVSGNNFLKDGKAWHYYSGSFHYFREIPERWEQIIEKMAAGGLNTLQTYVAWNLHEPEEGQFVWEGRADLPRFLDLAAKYNLSVILRPGPYICAEWDGGGLPYWVLKKSGFADAWRSSRAAFWDPAKKYLAAVYAKVADKVYSKGGPIIAVSIENEYGSSNGAHQCDKDYLNALADLAQEYLGDVALITCDNPDKSKLSCGGIPSRAVATVNFGSNEDPVPFFQLARSAMGGTGPFATSEYWTDYGAGPKAGTTDDGVAWSIPRYGAKFPTRNGENIAWWLDRQLEAGASVNMYMYYGGTNFDGKQGANGDSGSYEPSLWSYDYDAPLSEAGDLTDKWTKVREVIAKYRDDIPAITVRNTTKRGYGTVSFVEAVGLSDAASVVVSSTVESATPQTFESLNFGTAGYVLYEATATRAGTFSASVFDRATLLVNGKIAAKAVRPKALSATVAVGDSISVLVESLGRINYGVDEASDFKGLRAAPTVGGQALQGWTMSVIPLSQWDHEVPWGSTLVTGVPAFYRGTFEVDEPADTWLDPSGLDVGLAFVNGVLVGRYWPTAGPQVTLFVRSQILKPGTNELVVFEAGKIASVPALKFVSAPNLQGAVKSLSDV